MINFHTARMTICVWFDICGMQNVLMKPGRKKQKSKHDSGIKMKPFPKTLFISIIWKI